MIYEVWHYLDGRPAVLGEREDKLSAQKLKRTIADSLPAAISKGGLLLEWRGSSEKAWRLVVDHAWSASGGAPPAPLPVPTETPTRRLEGLRFGRGKPLAASNDDEEVEEVAVAPAPKPARPAATRPPLARRRTTSVAGGTLTSTPVDSPAEAPPSRCPIGDCLNPPLAASTRCEPAYRPLCASHRALAHRAARTHRLSSAAAVAHVASRAGQSPVLPAGSRGVSRPAPAVAAPPVAESTELQQARERATAAERALERCRDDANVAGVTAQREAEVAAAKIAGLQRLLGQVTVERDAHRDRAEVDAHHLEQLRGEVEALTTDLGVARRDLAVAVQQLNELSDRTGCELAQLRAELDEARAETATVLRQSGELSRQLGAAREEIDALRSAATVPASVLLDELMLERVAQRAARKAVALQGDAAKLSRLAQEHGGVDALVRLVEGALALRKAVG